MYEAHFGLSGPPFQLNPDPTFFFDSKGHKSALAYLRFGAHQGEGFIVVTGEIGAGKTTVVNALLNSLDRNQVVAAKVVSTQLEAGDLLRAIMAAFGVPPTAPSKAQLIATLEAFLTALAATGRRALLVIDEAQNLSRSAVEELRMLSNFQLGSHGLLQSFLVGQPELRALLQSSSMEQLRQRVIASCHLQPLDLLETQGYVEHRLRVVGWVQRPAIDVLAFAEIHRWTGGVPRRINRLCSRLLLAAYLAGADRIDSAMVLQTARDLAAEVGDTAPEPVRRPDTTPVSADRAASALDRPRPAPARERRRTILCLAESAADCFVARALDNALRDRGGMPEVVLAWTRDPGPGEDTVSDEASTELVRNTVVLAQGTRDEAGYARAVDRALTDLRPAAVVALGSGQEAFDASMRAFRAGVPVFRVNGGRRRWWTQPSERVRIEMFERLAATIYTDSLVSSHVLHRAGLPVDRVQCVGDLTGDAVREALSLSPADAGGRWLRSVGADDAAGQGYALATCTLTAGGVTPEEIARVVTRLEDVAQTVRVVWLVDPATEQELRASGQDQRLAASSVSTLLMPQFEVAVRLLCDARCLIATNSAVLIEPALALGVPSVVIDSGGVAECRIGDGGGWGVAEFADDLDAVLRVAAAQRLAPHDASKAPDGAAAIRIAEHLATLLPADVADDDRGPVPVDGNRRGAGRRAKSTPPRRIA